MGVTFRRNVIVVGAGASKEFGLPTGAELTQEIAAIADIRFNDFGTELVSGNHSIVDTLKLLVRRRIPDESSINPYLHAACRIRDNMPLAPSIDNYLDTHRDNAKVVEFGKLAICHAIQSAERKSKLFTGPGTPREHLNFSEVSNTWLGEFFKILVAQRTFEDLLEALGQITFVSFNYDRCIFQFFFHAGTSYFSLDHDGRARLMNSISVLYPYGSIGDFLIPGSNTTKFGEVQYGDALLDNVDGLRTFTEGTDSEMVRQIQECMFGAEVVMFLGFGFLQLNMDLLFQGEKFPPIRVLGTGKGLSLDSISEIESELRDIFFDPSDEYHGPKGQDRVRIIKCTCYEFFHEFQRYLTRA